MHCAWISTKLSFTKSIRKYQPSANTYQIIIDPPAENGAVVCEMVRALLSRRYWLNLIEIVHLLANLAFQLRQRIVIVSHLGKH